MSGDSVTPRRKVALVSVLIAIALITVGLLWPAISQPDTQSYSEKFASADPLPGGFHQVNLECTDSGEQEISFGILTQGQGELHVIVSSLSSETRENILLSEVVEVYDYNRDEVESRIFKSTVEAGSSVRFRVLGAGGAETAAGYTLGPLNCQAVS